MPVITNVRPASGPSPGGGASPDSSSVSPAAARSSSSSALLGNAIHSATDSATIGPTPSTSAISSAPAARSAASERKWLRDRLGGHGADVRDAEPEQHAAERALPGVRDRGDHVLGGALLEAVELEQLLDRQLVEVGRAPHQPELPEARHQALPDAVDVERAARDEMAQALEAAARAERIGAAVHAPRPRRARPWCRRPGSDRACGTRARCRRAAPAPGRRPAGSRRPRAARSRGRRCARP